jgi:hypothetical protein
MRKARGERMMGASWNLPMLFAPSAARFTNASTAAKTPSLPRAEDEVQRSLDLARAHRRARVRGRRLRIRVCVRAWAELHPKVQNHEGRGSRGPLPIVLGTLVLVEVERLHRGERRREPKILWLWWHGPEGTAPDLGLI